MHTSLAGMNLGNMSKCLKCAGNDDIITLKVSVNTPMSAWHLCKMLKLALKVKPGAGCGIEHT